MSIIFHQITSQNGGALPLAVGTGPPVDAIASQGLLINAAGQVYASLVTPPAFFCYGLPFDANSRLVVENAAIAYWSQGLPFTANNALAATADPAGATFSQGILLSPSGGFVATGLGPPIAPPGQVMGLDAQPAVDSANVTWFALTANPVVTSYTLQYRVNGTLPWTSQNVGNVTSFVLTGLTVGILYDVQCYATNAEGNGPPSAIDTVTPIGLIPGQVTGLIVISGLQELTVVWDMVTASPAVTSYTVQYRVDGSPTWISQNVGNFLNTTIPGLATGTLYNVRVYATNAEGNGPVSAVVNQSTYAVPTQVTGLVLVSGVNAIDATWNAVAVTPNVTSYTIEWRPQGSPTFASQNVGNVTTFNLGSLAPNQIYEVRVYATNIAGDGPPSAIGTQTTYAVPTIVQGLGVAPAIESLLVTWAALTFTPPVTSYTVQWKRDVDSVWNSQSAGVATNSTIAGLIAGTLYNVRVYATNAAGSGPPTAALNATPQMQPVQLLHYAEFNNALNSMYRTDTAPWAYMSLTLGLSGTTSAQASAYHFGKKLLAIGCGVNLNLYSTTTLPFTKLAGITNPANTILRLEFSPDGEYLAVATASGQPSYVYTTATWARRALGTTQDDTIALNLLNNLAVAAVPTGIDVWDISLPTPVLLADPPSSPTAQCWGADFYQNILAVCGTSVPCRIFNMTTNTMIGNVPGMTGSGYRCTFNNAGTRIAISYSAGFKIYDCTDILNPAAWVDLSITNPPAAVNDQNYSLSFSRTDNILSARDMTDPDQAIAFDMTVSPIARLPAFDIFRRNSLQQACFVDIQLALPALPATPTGLAATPLANGFTVTWNAVAGADVVGYAVQQKLAAGTTWTTFNVGLVTTTETTGMGLGQTADLRITTRYSLGYGQFSSSISATTLNVPTQTTGFVLNDGALKLTAQWAANMSTPLVNNYRLRWRIVGSGVWTEQNVGIVQTFVINNLQAGQTYEGQVAAENPLGLGAYSAIDTGLVSAPPVPTVWSAMTPQGLNSGSTTALWREIEYSPNLNRWLVAANIGWAARSDNIGAAWTAMVQNLASGGVNVSSRGLQANNVGVVVSLWANGYASRTTNDGTNWAALPQGLNSGDVNAQWFGLTTNGTNVFVAVANNGWAVRSADSGATWTALVRGLNSGNTSANFNDIDNNGSTFIAIGFTHDQCARSTDSGATWAALAPSTTVFNQANCVTYDAGSNTWLIGANGGYVLTSTNDGVTWTTRPQGLGLGFNGNILEADSDGYGRIVVVGTAGFAAYTTNGGANWTLLPAYLNSGASGATDISSIDNDKKGNWLAVLTDGRSARSII